MIRLAQLSIRRPRAALAAWIAVAAVLSLIGLGVSHSRAISANIAFTFVSSATSRQ